MPSKEKWETHDAFDSVRREVPVADIAKGLELPVEEVEKLK